MDKTRKLTFTSMFVAVGTLTSHLFFIPIGLTKVFPMQHLINVLLAVMVGPYYAVAGAFSISLFRNLLGTGSPLAFSGSMFGAFLAGILFWKTRKAALAFAGEVIGTGIVGAIVCYPLATLFLGKKAAIFGFVPSFIASSLAGAFFGFVLLTFMLKNSLFRREFSENSINNSWF